MKVFLSHSWHDNAFVRLFREDLEAAGVEAWVDEVRLKVADPLPIEIANALANSDYVLVFLSQHSIESRWVQKEMSIATSLEISGTQVHLLPIRLDDSAVPPLLADRLYADFRNPSQYDSEFRNILGRLNPDALPRREYSFYCLTLDSRRKDRLVRAAKSESMHTWVVDYLGTKLQENQRETEKSFAYYALGEIGGSRARVLVEAGLQDADWLVSKSAREAWQQLQGQNR
jgi:hypothetical protein